MTNYPALAYFGYKMKEARKQKGWQPSDLAYALRISPGEVIDMEAGKKDVSIVMAKEIAAALVLGITDLL